MKMVYTKNSLYQFFVTGIAAFLVYFLPQSGITEEIEARQTSITQVKLSSIESVGRIIVNIDDWPDIVGLKMPVQMKIGHTPNINGQCSDEIAAAQAAMTLTRQLMQNARDIHLRDIERGNGFYLLADVFADGINVGQEVRTLLMAAEKSGENQWCKPALRAGGKFKIKRN